MSQEWIDQRIQEIVGQMKRKERFDEGERICLEEVVERFGVHKGKCHTCAFRADSPETKAFYQSYPSQLSTVLENIDEAVEGNMPFEPFFCHRNMPSNDGRKNFQPEFDAEGFPIGHKICPGWLRMVNLAKKGNVCLVKKV